MKLFDSAKREKLRQKDASVFLWLQDFSASILMDLHFFSAIY